LRRGWLAGLALPLLVGVTGVGKGETPPGLYELMGRSDLAVVGRVVSGSLKLAQVEVVEVLRGSARPGERVQIAFRDLNGQLRKSERVLFQDDETDVLFLVPEMNAWGKPKSSDRYTLYRGRFGKFTLPREGAATYLEAAREFARLAALKDHRLLFAELRGLLASTNPIVVDSGLEEIFRLRIMDAKTLVMVVGYLQDASPHRRVSSLRLLAQYLEGGTNRTDPPDLQESVLPPVEVLVRNDPEEQVRVEAVRVLGVWGGDLVEPTLREVAEQDQAQSVRYEARVILLRHGGQVKQEPRKPETHP